ncbi:flagellar biosynthetic protein FliR [uncultured Hyphomonas sp.]|uniref:flagellar biosynthetic protein FliR n=1 Tax=uncultured Hyphomonas sp. TaxID=225298 RepID=UPI002AAB2E52|nr:flagellar biosynthetic protein FliR [uncultured Hyphomonas sp.]
MPVPDALSAWIALMMVIVARLSFIIFFMPGIGEQTVPLQMRVMILLALSAMFSISGFIAPPPTDSFASYAGVLATEVAIGFSLGVVLRVTIWMLSIAGTVISQSIGLSQLLGIALEHEQQTMTANLLSMAGAALLLSADFHIKAIASLLRLYTDVPIGALEAMNQDMLVQAFLSAFGLAIMLAWPFVAVNLLYNICLGFINKALPSLMVAFVGAPLMIGAGIILLALSVMGLLVVWEGRIPDIVVWQ